MATPAEIVAAIDTGIANLVAQTHQSYSINGRSFTLQSLSELRELRKYYAGLAADDSGNTRPSVARFGRPS